MTLMPTVSDMEPYIENEFGSRLEHLGFQYLGRRKWIRSMKLPIREIFVIGALGTTYCPAWGISLGLPPSRRGQAFKRQSTDKNATMDLIFDPIDILGKVPSETFSFFTGYHTEIPVSQIRTCAEHFVPLALADFDRVRSVNDFCKFFIERSRLQYARFSFYGYVRHLLVQGFILILTGHKDEGLEKIQEYCQSMDMDFDDRILSECIRHAELCRATA